MTRTAGAIAAAIAGGTLAVGTLSYSLGSAGHPGVEPVRLGRVEASPRVIDEGDLVELRADITSPEDVMIFVNDHVFEWDFGDGSKPLRGFGLGSVIHRFTQSSSVDHFVSVAVDDDDSALVALRVRNVPPTIVGTARTRPATRGRAVSFEATATDPGLNDRLTYAWDFADGGAATGQKVRHTFTADGRYDVSVTVDDGDGGQDSATMTVIVGNGFEYAVGGDAQGRATGQVLFGGFTRDGVCHARLVFQPDGLTRDTPTLGIVVGADGGLSAGRYAVGNPGATGLMREGGLPVQRAHADEFLASLGAKYTGPTGPEIHPANYTFHSSGGIVDIEYLDAGRIEGTFTIQMEETPPLSDWRGGPDSAWVTGHFATAYRTALSGPDGGGPFDAYLCEPQTVEKFDVASHTPARDARNVDPMAPEVRVSFTAPVDPASLDGRIRLEYGLPFGAGNNGIEPADYNQVPGTWEVLPGDDRTIRFVPQDRLLDGVIHCLRIRTGRQGVRGRGREILEPDSPAYADRNRPACEGGRPWAGAREWAFSTFVDLEAVTFDVYQVSAVSEDIPLVAGKPSVARVYAHWSEKDSTSTNGVNAWSQVRRFPARVSVQLGASSDGRPITAPMRVTVTRPDLFNDEDRRQALSSINLFGWRPDERDGVAELRAVIEPVDEAGRPVRKFESEVQRVPYWTWTDADKHSRHDAPVLSVDYRFILLDGPCGPRDSVHDVGIPRTSRTGTDLERAACADWSSGVPDGWRRLGHDLMRAAAQFTTQNFPVVDTQLYPMPDLRMAEPPAGTCSRSGPKWQRCYFPGVPGLETPVSRRVALALWEAARDSPADVVVGLVPPGFVPSTDWIGVMTSWGVPDRRLVLLQVDEADPAAVAHEFGHFFTLNHCPVRLASLQCSWAIRGFRISASGASGVNKQAASPGTPGEADYEGNGEAGPLKPLQPLMASWAEPSVRLPGEAAVPQASNTTNTRLRFITNESYRKLLDAKPRAPRRTAAARSRRDGPHEHLPLVTWLSGLFEMPVEARTGQSGPRPLDNRLRVGGVLSPDGVVIDTVRIDRLPVGGGLTPDAIAGDVSPGDGDAFHVELIDDDGKVLADGAVSVLRIDTEPGSDLDTRFFLADLPVPAGGRSVRITRNGQVLAEKTRTAHAPALSGLDARPDGHGGVRVAWSAVDVDGDVLRFDVAMRDASGADWRVAAVGLEETALTLGPADLPAGPDGVVRVTASDGFDTVTAEARLTVGRPLRVLSTTPAPDAVRVPLVGDIVVQLSAVLSPDAIGSLDRRGTPPFRLEAPDGASLLADLTYQPGASLLLLTPAAPLRPGTRYRLTLGAGLKAANGAALAETVAWSFVTESLPGGVAPSDRAPVATPAACDCSCAGFQAYLELDRRRASGDPEAAAELRPREHCATECGPKWIGCRVNREPPGPPEPPKAGGR